MSELQRPVALPPKSNKRCNVCKCHPVRPPHRCGEVASVLVIDDLPGPMTMMCAGCYTRWRRDRKRQDDETYPTLEELRSADPCWSAHQEPNA
jgi:hypothetical protein